MDANNRVFSGHPENGNWRLADLDRRRRLPWFSAEGFRMAWDGAALAGFCWTKTPSRRAGEIYVIGVLPEYQGMGLGKALLLEGAGHMHAPPGRPPLCPVRGRRQRPGPPDVPFDGIQAPPHGSLLPAGAGKAFLTGPVVTLLAESRSEA